MSLWLLERDTFLLELLRLDGRGDYVSQYLCRGCAECPLPPLYRCKDCFSTELYCQRCTVEKHHANPLHKIEVRTVFLVLGTRLPQLSFQSTGIMAILPIRHSKSLDYVSSLDIPAGSVAITHPQHFMTTS